MPLNLITDPWIPVIDKSGNRRIVAPWQIADSALFRPDWPRVDLNIGCLELLIGLVYMADPPTSGDDWEDRATPDPERLREKLAAYAPAFNLIGDGPLFLQDLEPLGGEPNAPDMLFIDSAGVNTAYKNADLMVHRRRYTGLDLPLAAMALFTIQAYAPSGGAGNRTSMRGGGPMVTLVDPGLGLWSIIWANVPSSTQAAMSELPWMYPTRVSDKNLKTRPPQGQKFSVEAFFGAPRRLRLVAEGDVITGVIQKPHGTDYAGWVHPLSPYYRMKVEDFRLPVHPKAGTFGYRHWLGILVQSRDSELAERAHCVDLWQQRSDRPARVIVAGWSMAKATPADFTYSVEPLIDLTEDQSLTLAGLISAADNAAVALRGALVPVLAEGGAREAEREAFYIATETAFLARLTDLKSGKTARDICAAWLADLRNEAIRRFDAISLPSLDQRDTSDIQKIVVARRNLAGTFAGYGKFGKLLFKALDMDPPSKRGNAA
ncbi:type I-E CRISPR-associated protein Cse1/CasA [Thalassospira sp.]|uniref:type I-E CRISPR-associated protein Cse1/CasA n=1 Tax=Thalassospira sp. TaxID=1912094 RepID=UPI0027363E95|nr:type I-E CRISPR-associated protein Cse1/CasA [Thalassospira sp.]MDP2699915.1 type I-E CRISPR-associated protein Cse1/CasA [Thalassospira sp.]